MTINQLFGKKITNIYATFAVEQNWLDTADCYIELDNQLVIGFPNNFSNEVWVRNIEPAATSLFENLADYPVYHLNKEGKSIKEIASAYQKRSGNLFAKINELLFGYKVIPKEYTPYRVEYRENKLKYVKGSAISDFIRYPDISEKGLFLLENGFVITETTMSPSGTGLAGLNYYETINEMIEAKGASFQRLSEHL